MKTTTALSYATGGHKAIEGWLTTEAATTIHDIAQVQLGMNIRGGACEIGVHHGRLFILLEQLLRPDERALAVDLFELQNENVDGSGLGSRERLTRNLTRLASNPARIELLACNSMRLTAARITQSVGPVRLFSVDGGHTADITYNDLALAAQSVCDGGLVILDDFMSSRWPGVTEGACYFMRDHRELLPVAYVSNKLILARGDSAPYRAIVAGEEVEMFGRPAIVSRKLSWREQMARTPLWQSIRGNRLGSLVRHLMAHVSR